MDLVWQWAWRETIEVAIETFRRQLELTHSVHSYTYCQGQAALYETVEKAAPFFFLLGKLYFLEEFGADVGVAWQMASTGLPPCLPQILRGFGFRGAIIGRGRPWTDLFGAFLHLEGKRRDGDPVGVVGPLLPPAVCLIA